MNFALDHSCEAHSGSHPCESLWNHSDSAGEIRHRHLISYSHVVVLFCCLPASVACTPCWVANNWVLVKLFQSVVYLPAITGSSFCEWLLCILRKISNDFHLSMQFWVFREFPIILNLFFFFIFLVMCPKFKMTEIAYRWQINKFIVGHIVYLIFANCVQQRIQWPPKIQNHFLKSSYT